MQTAKELKPSIPTSQDKAMAFESTRQLMKFLQSSKVKTNSPVRVSAGSGGRSDVEISVPVMALRLFVEVLSEMSKGNAITILPLHAELTTQEAAEFLNVSRPFLIQLLDDQKVPFRKVGKHRRVLVEDLLRFKENLDAERRKVLDKIAQESQKLGLE